MIKNVLLGLLNPVAAGGSTAAVTQDAVATAVVTVVTFVIQTLVKRWSN